MDKTIHTYTRPQLSYYKLETEGFLCASVIMFPLLEVDETVSIDGGNLTFEGYDDVVY